MTPATLAGETENPASGACWIIRPPSLFGICKATCVYSVPDLCPVCLELVSICTM